MDTESGPSPEVGSQGNEFAIASLAKDVYELFKDIRQETNEDVAVIARLPTLFKQVTGEKPVFTIVDFVDEFEQYHVWIKNLGVLATDHSSLDYRLRDAEDVRIGILAHLKNLQAELNECQQLLHRDRNLDNIDGSTDSSSESDESNSVVSEVIDSTRWTASELQHRFGHIADLINKLIKLAEVIRASGVRNRVLRAADYVHWEDGVNQTEIFEEHYLPQVLKLRFGLDEPILSRCCRAIAMRRRQFMYQKKHQKRLAYGYEEISFSQPDPRAGMKLGRGSKMFTSVSAPTSESATNQTKSYAVSELHPPTKATTFEKSSLKRKAPSTIMSKSVTKSVANEIDIPPAPTLARRATHFVCPYCCLLVRGMSRPRWRKHLLTDLKPYICIEPECARGDLGLETQEEWVEHQRWEHAMEWWCNGDDETHDPICFRTMDGFAEHLVDAHHPKMSHKDLEKRVAAAGRPSLVPLSCCPFCDFLPDVMKPSNLSTSEDSVRQLTAAQSMLQDHIASELLQMFLIALPDRDDINDINSDTERSRIPRSSILALSDVSLTFSADENHNDSGGTQIESDSHPELAVPEPPTVTPTGDSFEEMWEVVWTSLNSEQCVRNAYDGPENDQILIKIASLQVDPVSTQAVVPSITLTYLDVSFPIFIPQRVSDFTDNGLARSFERVDSSRFDSFTEPPKHVLEHALSKKAPIGDKPAKMHEEITGKQFVHESYAEYFVPRELEGDTEGSLETEEYWSHLEE